jgi:hypothetical protein
MVTRAHLSSFEGDRPFRLQSGKTWRAVTDHTTTLTVAAEEDLTVNDRTSAS